MRRKAFFRAPLGHIEMPSLRPHKACDFKHEVLQQHTRPAAQRHETPLEALNDEHP